MTIEYRTVEEFRRRFPQEAAAEVRRYGMFGTEEAAERFMRYLRLNTPINSSGDRSGHADLASSWRRLRIAVSGRSLGAGGFAYAVGNVAPHAGVLNQGRRRNKRSYLVRIAKGKPYRIPAGRRMLGSQQAPWGVIAPAWDRLRKERNAVEAIARARYERSGG